MRAVSFHSFAKPIPFAGLGPDVAGVWPQSEDNGTADRGPGRNGRRLCGRHGR